MPKDSGRVNSLSIIFDSYKENSIKQMMQLERASGEIGRDVYITNMKQKTPQNAHSYPIIIAEEEKTWHLSSTKMLELPSSNHVEADTQIIMDALKKEKTVICQGY